LYTNSGCNKSGKEAFSVTLVPLWKLPSDGDTDFRETPSSSSKRVVTAAVSLQKEIGVLILNACYILQMQEG
jgi:hypothetical protein